MEWNLEGKKPQRSMEWNLEGKNPSEVFYRVLKWSETFSNGVERRHYAFLLDEVCYSIVKWNETFLSGVKWSVEILSR